MWNKQTKKEIIYSRNLSPCPTTNVDKGMLSLKIIILTYNTFKKYFFKTFYLNYFFIYNENKQNSEPVEWQELKAYNYNSKKKKKQGKTTDISYVYV